MGRGHDVALDTLCLYSNILQVATKSKYGVGFHVSISNNNAGVHCVTCGKSLKHIVMKNLMFDYFVFYSASTFFEHIHNI